MPTRPPELMRSASDPEVVTVNVSAAGNLIAVLSSLRWKMESAIPTPPANCARVDVLILSVDAAPTTLPSEFLNPCAVTIPTKVT